LFWFAIALCLFPALLFMGLGIGLMFLFCFLTLAAVVLCCLGLFILLCYFMGLFGFVLRFVVWGVCFVVGGL